MRSRVLLLLLALMPLVPVLGQAGTLPPALQLTRTVTVPLSKAQVGGLLRAAWDNSFGLDPGAKLEPQTLAGAFEGTAHFAFRSADLNGRERSAGNIHYRVTLQAENGSCLVRVHQVVHHGSEAAKGGAIDIGTLREQAPTDLRIPGMSRSSAARLYTEARDAANDRLNERMSRFEATLRDRATP